MEKNGIGTDASMATHINNIIERGYVKVETKNRKLIPLELGKALILGIKSIDKELVYPQLRQNIEKAID
jgi:DNA topoisomerase-3